jgi:hypothetical protein
MTKLFTLLLIALAALPCAAFGQMVKSKGRGEIVYSGTFRAGSAEERAAILEAKKNALARYAAGLEPARFELFRRIEPEVMQRLDEFVTDYVQIDQQVDKTSRRFSVVIEASINASLLESFIQSRSATSVAAGAEASFMTFIFVSRELASRRAFDAKRTEVEILETSSEGSETREISEAGNSAESALSTATTRRSVSGGNTETKAEELAYRVTTNTEVDAAVNSVLSTAGYETVNPSDVGLDVEAFKSDFSSNSDMLAETRSAAIRALRENEVRYLAVATMDIGLPEIDPVTGQTKVYVAVTAKVTDLGSRLPRTVASIAGTPYSGLGTNAQVARQTALNEAARRSAAELVDQLRLKNIR